MEQFIEIMKIITIILMPIMYLLAIGVLIIIASVMIKINKMTDQARLTLSSVQQISQIPLQIVNTLLQKILGR